MPFFTNSKYKIAANIKKLLRQPTNQFWYLEHQLIPRFGNVMQAHTPRNAFDAYCWALGFENPVIARELSVSPEMVRKWRLPIGDPNFTRPSPRKIEAIHAYTKGKVTPNHWFDLQGVAQ